MSLEKEISLWLKDYLLNNNLDSFVIGISGGIDSAFTSTLCAMAGCKTIVVTMPIHQNPDETDRGMQHCSWLNENYDNIICFLHLTVFSIMMNCKFFFCSIIQFL